MRIARASRHNMPLHSLTVLMTEMNTHIQVGDDARIRRAYGNASMEIDREVIEKITGFFAPTLPTNFVIPYRENIRRNGAGMKTKIPISVVVKLNPPYFEFKATHIELVSSKLIYVYQTMQ